MMLCKVWIFLMQQDVSHRIWIFRTEGQSVMAPRIFNIHTIWSNYSILPKMSTTLFLRAPISLVLVAVCSALLSKPLKQKYVIGGWIPGNANLFLQKWRPLLQDYLSATVGSQYAPPISFEVIPVDYSEATLSAHMIKSGQVDFICEWQNSTLLRNLTSWYSDWPDNTPGTLICIEAEYG